MSPQTTNADSRAPQRGVPITRVRKRLPHEVPLWIDPAKQHYFITFCSELRGRNLLAFPRIGHPLLETIKHRQSQQIWYAHVAVIMPDHVHLIVTFPESGKPVQTIISKWKEWTAKSLGIRWQRDFFEHRLRRDESFREKADYVLANPVRAGLVENAGDWPYTFVANPW